MALVHEIMGTRLKNGEIGIEIETEAAARYNVPEIPGWVAVNDGSLRDFGREYVTDGPIKYSDLAPSLKNWKDGLGAIHGRLRKDSISTSVHIHLNVQDHTPLQCLNLYLCNVLFENVLANYAGPDRIGNLFCLRTVDAEDLYDCIKGKVKNAHTEVNVLQSFNPNGYKYSNINTVPITNYGSMEFRVMRGTTDIDEIRIWTEALYSIREFAKQFANPVEIVRKMKELGPEGLLIKVLGANYDVFRYRNWERDLLRNFIYVADMACARKNWDFKAYDASEKKSKKSDHSWIINAGDMPQPVFRNAAPAAPQPAPAVIQWDEDFEEEDM